MLANGGAVTWKLMGKYSIYLFIYIRESSCQALVCFCTNSFIEDSLFLARDLALIKMVSAFTSVKALPVLAVGAFAAASYPPIPVDLTTPVQQRIAVNGPNSMFIQPEPCKNASKYTD